MNYIAAPTAENQRELMKHGKCWALEFVLKPPSISEAKNYVQLTYRDWLTYPWSVTHAGSVPIFQYSAKTRKEVRDFAVNVMDKHGWMLFKEDDPGDFYEDKR